MSIFYIEILLFAILSIGSVILISMSSRLKRVENDTMYINSYTRRNKLSIDTLETQVLANNALIHKPKAKRGRPRKSKAIVHELGN